MAMSFSTSKGVVSTLLHILADRGLLDYDDPVARYWPEFGQAGKESITIREVLSHRSGLPHLRPLVDDGEQILDWGHMVRALERARPGLQPGRRSAYHAFTYGWLVGEVIQRITGRSLPDVLRTELTEPLGLDGLYIGAPPEAKERAAELGRPGSGGPLPKAAGLLNVTSWTGPLTGMSRAAGVPFDPKLMLEALLPPGDPALLFEPRMLDVPIPAANGLFTARSLARIYAMIAAGGTLDGVRLLSPETISRASEIQTFRPDRVLMLPMHWRLGYHSAFTSRGRIPSAFGHFGYGGSGAFADPKRELAVAMVNNKVGGGPFGDARIAFVANAALLAARAVRRRRDAARRMPVAAVGSRA
jgi:CubicO group peptidase (beta-lactamase class C family)